MLNKIDISSPCQESCDKVQILSDGLNFGQIYSIQDICDKLSFCQLCDVWSQPNSSGSSVTCDRQIDQNCTVHPLNQNILFCDVKAIKIIVTQMEVQNLGINSVFVLFTSDKSIENVSTYHKKCEDSAHLHLMCIQRPCIHEIQHFATQVLK